MITIKDLAFSYGKKLVLQNISMTIKPGNIYGLLGENGVGKTTLLTLMSGLKKVASGSIETDGKDPYRRQPSLLEDQYYIPDEVAPRNQKAICFAREEGRFWPRFSLDKFSTILKEFEADEDQKMDMMSSGQLKKVYIAFALATNARYQFMDEPTNGLDIPSKALFRRAITKYTSEDSAIVISTHQVRDLEDIIDPIIILDNKAVLLNASIKEISEKVSFDYGTQIHQDDLYMEQSPAGAIQVYPNVTGEESKVNIEAFFIAVHKNKELIKAMFSSADNQSTDNNKQ